MPSMKDRLYVALYARGGESKMPGGEDKYHWAILMGPKAESPNSEGRMFHARERMVVAEGGPRIVWEFEERTTSMAPTAMILVRILLGKVVDTKRLESVVRSTAIKGTQPGWNCVAWVQEVLEGLQTDGKALGRSVTDWASVRYAALRYVEAKKAQHRFDDQGQFDRSNVATWSLLDEKELIA